MLRGQGRRSKVPDLLHGYNCQLGLGLVTLIKSSVVNPNTNPVGLVTLMKVKDQRSQTFVLIQKPVRVSNPNSV